MTDDFESRDAGSSCAPPIRANVSSSDRPQAETPSATSLEGESQPLSGDARQAAVSVAAQAKQKLTGALEARKGTAADYVEQLAQTVQRSGQQFESQQDWLAGAIGRGAAELNTLAGTIRDKDLGQLASEAQSFARTQPALFMGAALAAGFAVARLGKVAAGSLSREDLPTMPEMSNGQH